MPQAGDVVEEGTHEELWARPDSVYHSLVALQEAATDRRDQAAEMDLEEIARKDEERAVAAVVKVDFRNKTTQICFELFLSPSLQLLFPA
jgi:hypothetical protein